MSSDYVAFDMVLDHERGELWRLLGNPELYPRFFRGISRCERASDGESDRPGRYRLRACFDNGHVIDYALESVIDRPEEKLVLADMHESRGWVSFDLTAIHATGTRVAIVFGKPGLLRPRGTAWSKAQITAWARDALDRMSAYLSGAGTSVLGHGGGYASMQLAVAKTVMRAGVVSARRPDRGIRQLNALGRWGFTLAGGYASAEAKAPDAVAIADERGTRTYREICERTTRLAAGLSTLGLGQASTAAVLARNHATHVECMLACGKLGTDLVLLNTGLSTRQVEDIVERHEVTTLFVDEEFAPLTQYLPETVRQLSTSSPTEHHGRRTVEDVIAGAPATDLTPPERAGTLIVLTSGTTGTPKGARRPTPKRARRCASG
jgi:uncharacterized protein YndB with AHSA1/START domain